MVEPLAAYTGLAFSFLSDSINTRFGRRKPLLLPLAGLTTLGWLMYYTPVGLQAAGMSVPFWYLASKATYMVGMIG